MSWLRRVILQRFLSPLVLYLEGKKTILGAISVLLWILIYGIPILYPDHVQLKDISLQLRDLLLTLGLDLDRELLNTGVGLTVVGLLDKLRRLYNNKSLK